MDNYFFQAMLQDGIFHTILNQKWKTNPKKNSSYKTLSWHDAKQAFNSVLSLKAKVAETYPGEAADNLSFREGYYHGRGSNKLWLIEDRDLSEMYKKIDKTSVSLWCEGKLTNDESS